MTRDGTRHSPLDRPAAAGGGGAPPPARITFGGADPGTVGRGHPPGPAIPNCPGPRVPAPAAGLPMVHRFQ